MRRAARACAVLAIAALSASAAHAQISLYTVVDLARRNSSAVQVAQADVAKANAALAQTRDVYIPSLTAGSAAGYSYGFLGGVPSVFNAQIQSLLISFSQPDYIRAARAGLRAAMLSLQDALDQVELDSALDYLQLNSITEQLAALDEQKQYGERLQAIEQDRLSAGVESQIAATRAELTVAQADLKRLDLEAQATVLRRRLSDLTGLPAGDIKPAADTIPGAPVVDTELVLRLTAGVDAGYSSAVAKHYVAHGDARQNYRPQIGFAFTYDYLDTTLNNYNNYYNNLLRPNNFGIAAQISFPLFNATQAAHARETAAEAVRADALATQGRQLADENRVQLQASLAELRAQARVADLQAKLAEQNVEIMRLQLTQAPSAGSAAPLTPADEMQARINERARYTEALDAHFELLKAQLSLLRVTGGIHAWVNTPVR